MRLLSTTSFGPTIKLLASIRTTIAPLSYSLRYFSQTTAYNKDKYMTLNPHSGLVEGEHRTLTDEELASKVEAAAKAAEEYKHTSFRFRSDAFKKLASLLEERSKKYGSLITREMGKPTQQAVAEVNKCALLCRYFADHAEAALQPEVVKTEASKSYACYQPMGVVFGIFPWNFPFWQAIRCTVPAMMAGNVMLMKHAPNVPLCAAALEEVFHDAGLMQGAFQNLYITLKQSENLIKNPVVKGVSLTGSVGAGSSVGSSSGAAIKKSILELGGSDPFIVLADADLDKTIPVAVNARMQNCGQTCIAAKRFIVEEPIYDEFVERFAEGVMKLEVGDPTSESTNIGPMSREDLRASLHRQVVESVKMGAKLHCGGEELSTKGFYYLPTVLSDVTPDMPVFKEETFGPCASIVKAKNAEDAVRLANMSQYGLGGAVFTKDEKRGEQIALKLECGLAFVNEFVKSDPRLPFGGVKQSGYGRECSLASLKEFVNIKTVWIK